MRRTVWLFAASYPCRGDSSHDSHSFGLGNSVNARQIKAFSVLYR
jgi:hypothetical protein